MSTSEDFLKAGSPAQQEAIAGIAFGHAYEKHGQELPASSQREFGASAYRDLNTADRVYEFNQHGGPALLFANQTSGMVGWINTSNPECSTYFRPEFGLEDYVEDKLIHEDLVRDLSVNVPELDSPNGSLEEMGIGVANEPMSPDLGDHVNEEISDLDVDVSDEDHER